MRRVSFISLGEQQFFYFCDFVECMFMRNAREWAGNCIVAGEWLDAKKNRKNPNHTTG